MDKNIENYIYKLIPFPDKESFKNLINDMIITLIESYNCLHSKDWFELDDIESINALLKDEIQDVEAISEEMNKFKSILSNFNNCLAFPSKVAIF